MPDISPTVVALISALLGGSGLKFIDYWLGRSKTKDDSALAFRNELREEVANLRTQITTAEENEKQWRDKYYTVIEENLSLKAEAEAAKAIARLKEIEAQRIADEKEATYIEQLLPKTPAKRAPRKRPATSKE